MREEGLIAVFDGELPAASVIEIGDALLASPILVLQITLSGDGALDAITLLRERFGEHMLIGAGAVLNFEHLDAATAAGAQFTMANRLDQATVEQAHSQDFLHIPGVDTYADARAAHHAGSRAVQLNVDDDKGPLLLQNVRSLLNEVEYIVSGDVAPHQMSAYRHAGAAAVCLSTDLVTGADQPMDDLITKARTFRAAWLGEQAR